jgi:uncharacterized phage-associated protein
VAYGVFLGILTVKALQVVSLLQRGGFVADRIIVESGTQEIGRPVEAKLVADYILTLSHPEEGDILSHLKLQKLLYYCQGFHLALYKQPLFIDRIFHWEHGPVVETVYHAFKEHGGGALPVPSNVDFSALTRMQRETISEVYEVYGQFSAWKLRQMTHEEEPWLKTPDRQEISIELLTTFFQSRLHA